MELGVIIAAPGNCLICGMFNQMWKTFSTKSWTGHSVALLTKLVNTYRDEVTLVLPMHSFYYGDWTQRGLKAVYGQSLPEHDPYMYGIHLWHNPNRTFFDELYHPLTIQAKASIGARALALYLPDNLLISSTGKAMCNPSTIVPITQEEPYTDRENDGIPARLKGKEKTTKINRHLVLINVV